jgi:NAD-dependent DNA ligase
MGEDFMRKLRERTAHISFAGMTFCLSGQFGLPKEGIKMGIEGKYGGKVTESVSKKTTYLVVPDGEIDEESAKVKRARELKVKIIKYEELKKMMGLDDENLRDL